MTGKETLLDISTTTLAWGFREDVHNYCVALQDTLNAKSEVQELRLPQ
jgi:hypothetical protein